jgi:hypothetical protein
MILTTKDGGVNWAQEGSGVEDDLIDICYVARSLGDFGYGLWAIGKNIIIRRK